MPRDYKPVDNPEQACTLCGKLFKGRSDKRYCSTYCRIKANRLGHETPPARPSTRFAILERDRFHCRYCGRGPEDGVKLIVDHVIPWSKGGDNSPANLVTACMECNTGKGSRILRNLP